MPGFPSLPGAGTSAVVRAIYRYPVKGLSPEALAAVDLVSGETLPFDRAYAIENGPGRFDADAPRHLPKINFLMLMRDERLARLATHFDTTEHTLTISRDGKPVARGDLRTRAGRAIVEQFMAAFMKDSLRGAPKVVSAAGHSFSDVAAKCVHIVNLASLREVERAMGRALDPVRFRPNLVVDTGEPWQEMNWVGQAIGAGKARLEVLKRTERCAATNVDPATGERNTDIPAVLARHWGHTDFGIYARVVAGGRLAVGDRLTPPL